jgi:hypothetical protein
MVYQPNLNNPHRATRGEEEMQRQTHLNNPDDQLQADPQLAEGPASGAKVAMYAVAIAIVLGAVFYGLNNRTVDQATTPSQTAQQVQPANPAAPSGTGDGASRAGAEADTTTGAATTNRPTPPSSKPTGTEVDRSKQ